MKLCKIEVENLVDGLVVINIAKLENIYVKTTDMYLNVEEDNCKLIKLKVLEKTEIASIYRKVVRPKSSKAVNYTNISTDKPILSS